VREKSILKGVRAMLAQRCQKMKSGKRNAKRQIALVAAAKIQKN